MNSSSLKIKYTELLDTFNFKDIQNALEQSKGNAQLIAIIDKLSNSILDDWLQDYMNYRNLSENK